MKITSAEFVKSVVGTEEVLESELPQITFVGRSNVGKSSTINALLKRKNLARVSSMPGRTQLINVFFINRSFYLVDVPGYGYAKVSKEDREWFKKLIRWYLFKSDYDHKAVVFIIDAFVGPTDKDFEMLEQLEHFDKPIIILANKIDKIPKSEYEARMTELRRQFINYQVIPFSAKKTIGVGQLGDMLQKALSNK